MNRAAARHPMLIWMRAEIGAHEHRAPLAPAEAGQLVAAGWTIIVEDCTRRAFGADEYAAAGCRMAERGSWAAAPANAWVLGLKAPFDEPRPLRHRHIFFAHAFKGQAGAAAVLERFRSGGGQLYDLEYVTDERGKRKLAFGYWAGFAGAALAVLAPQQRSDLLPHTNLPALRQALQQVCADAAPRPRALVIGARGRCGQGAVDALRHAGIEPALWNREQTRIPDKRALMAHDLVVNCIGLEAPVPPFLVARDFRSGSKGRLRMLVDVTCDFGSALNAFPVYARFGSLDAPFVEAPHIPHLSVLAVANLPSLLPRESSQSFSAALARELLHLPGGDPWQRAHAMFVAAMKNRKRLTSIVPAAATVEAHS